MTLEKKIAIVSVILCLLTPLAFLIYLEMTIPYEIETSLRIELFFTNLAWFWGSMTASFILYTKVRSAAVSAAALLTLTFHSLLAYSLAKEGVSDGGLIWFLYFFWCGACFVVSIFPALSKPAMFVRSAKSAFFSTLMFHLLAAPLAMMIFKVF